MCHPHLHRCRCRERPTQSPSTVCSAVVEASRTAFAGSSTACTVRDPLGARTPLEGLVIGTRSGDLDPAVVFYLHREAGLSIDDIDDLLNKRSGILGLAGANGMREVERRAAAGDQGRPSRPWTSTATASASTWGPGRPRRHPQPHAQPGPLRPPRTISADDGPRDRACRAHQRGARDRRAPARCAAAQAPSWTRAIICASSPYSPLESVVAPPLGFVRFKEQRAGLLA